MLIKREVLDRIVTGEVDTLFRKQRRPTVRSGGTLRTSIGVLRILSVDEVDERRILAADARRAGATSVEEVRAALAAKADGTVYRVRVAYGGDDPRIALRERPPTDEELTEVVDRLARLDRRRAAGPWTRSTLELIADRPHVRAPDLAAHAGRDTARFKSDVRTLKELGLTISHSPGYELSARGRSVLDRLRTQRAGS